MKRLMMTLLMLSTIWTFYTLPIEIGPTNNEATPTSSPTGICGNKIEDDSTGIEPVSAGISLDALYYPDEDGDGFGSAAATGSDVQEPGFVADNTDCDDANPEVYPGAVEVEDGIDNDCDGLVDETAETTWYEDADGDSYGNPDSALVQVEQPAGYVKDNTDCDDKNPEVNPGAKEIEDGIDNDCDGLVDETPETTWYEDADGDAFGNPNRAVVQVEQPAGYVKDNTDCDDANPEVYPGAKEIEDGIDNDCDGSVDEVDTTWYEDADGDSFGNPVVSIVQATQPVGYVSDGTDCDDTDATVYPGAVELADGKDNDCDGTIDEGLGTTWFEDADGDGFGNPASSITQITQPAGYVSDSTDCDDTDATIYPGAPEIENDGKDNDCDGTIDETPDPIWYLDQDGDGYGDPEVSKTQKTQPVDYVDNNSDCDDTDATIYPGAPEIADDGKDNNCDGTVDEVEQTYYKDSDGDGYGDPESSVTQSTQPEGYVTDSSDCDDTNPDVHPGAIEVQDGIDNNCDGVVDEGFDSKTWYKDSDGDGYGDPESSMSQVEQPEGYVEDNTDCDDTNAEVNPGAEEIEGDGIDNNCDGVIDEKIEGDEDNTDVSLSLNGFVQVLALSIVAIPILKRKASR